MLKVMIVDDELLARLALRTAINWEDHGFEVVAEAEDGLTGYEYVRQYRPDIVLTDISMPGMNGVELIKKTKEFCPEIELIILSCHNDFEYVKEGLRSGAADYILKLSMSMEELLKELLKLKEKILNRQTRQVGQGISQEREKWPGIMFSLITKEEGEYETALGEGKEAGLLDESAYGVLAILSVDSQEGRTPDYPQTAKITRLAEAVMTRYKVGTYIPFEGNRGLILCQAPDLKTAFVKAQGMEQMLGELMGLIYDYHGVRGSGGISLPGRCSGLKVCYCQAYEALSQKFYTGPGMIHRYAKGIGEEVPVVDGLFRNLLKSMDSLNWDTVGELAGKWMDGIAGYRYPGVLAVKKNMHELLLKIGSHIMVKTEGETMEHLVENAYHQIQKQSFLGEMRETLLDFFAQAEKSGIVCNDTRREIIQAKKYVSQYYTQTIKLAEVAEQVNMNVDYFSHLFKKETGNSFTDYLNRFRIEKAKVLLQSGQYKVYQVAFAVGFQDENYFIRRFKKQTGYTPMEYIRLLGSKMG